MAQALPYDVEDREMVAETPDLRVVILTLGPGHVVPWHFHSNVTDTFFCMEGPMIVTTQGGRNKTELAAGERYAVPSRTAHHVSGKDGGRCKFAIVQGIGTYDFVSVDVP